MRASQLACVAGVLGAGVLAAWPFRQYATHSAPPPAAMPLDLTLRQPDVTLQPSPPGDDSPAVGLDLVDERGESVSIQPAVFSRAAPAASRTGRPNLEDLGPPPELPIVFSPANALPPPAAFVPQTGSSPRWSARQSRPKQYKLRDGDTLEDLAQRHLGTRTRAEEIYAANRDVLASPDLLPVGLTIVIPPKQRADDLEP